MNKLVLAVLAGAAAFAYYKYSKMSEAEKEDLVNNLKEKGKKIYDEYVPGNLKKAADNLS